MLYCYAYALSTYKTRLVYVAACSMQQMVYLLLAEELLTFFSVRPPI